MATTKVPKHGALFSINAQGEVEDAWIHAEILGDDDPTQDPYYRDLSQEIDATSAPPDTTSE